jgi:hypothetical protein
MKYLKILGLAAVAAMALAAFAGAGTASASTLCKTTVAECPAAWDWPSGTEIHAVLDSSTATLETTEGFELIDTCTGSTTAGKTSNTGSSTETVGGPLSSLTFTGCTFTTKVLKAGSLEIHADGDTGAGILTSKEAEVTVLAFGFIDCIAKTGTGTTIGTMDEPASASSDATMTVNATIPLSGGGCPATSKWTAEYTVTTPTPLYVSTS